MVKSIEEQNKEWDEIVRKIHYPNDPTIENVLNKFKNRADGGMKTYSVSMKSNKGDLLYWMNHLQEEMMDSVAYIERIIQEVKDGK
jgi:hypothetical protein